jgi:hypothetical protein
MNHQHRATETTKPILVKVKAYDWLPNREWAEIYINPAHISHMHIDYDVEDIEDDSPIICIQLAHEDEFMDVAYSSLEALRPFLHIPEESK